MSAVDCRYRETNAIYTFLLVVYISLSCTGFLLNSALFFAIIQSKFLPKNVTFLIGNLTLALLLNVVPALVRNMTYVTILRSGHLVPLTPLFCAQNSIRILIACVIIVSMGSLGLERWMITRKLQQNNGHGTNGSDKKSIVIILLVSGIWILALVSAVVTVNTKVYQVPIPVLSHNASTTPVPSTFHDERAAVSQSHYWCACPKVTSQTIRLLVTTTPYLIFEVFITGLYLKIWRVNKQKLSEFNINSHTHSLENRFEIRQNIRTTLMMLPTVLAHGVCWIAVMTTLYLQPLWTGDDLQESTISLLIQIFFETYCFLHPISIFSRSKQLRATTFWWRKRVQLTPEVTMGTQGRMSAAQNIKVIPKNPTGTKDVHLNAMEYRMKPEEGVEIVEKIWGQKSRPQLPRPKSIPMPKESLVEIDQIWEGGLPKRHRRPTKGNLFNDGGTATGLSSFIDKLRFSDRDAKNKKKERKYELRGMPKID